MSRVLSIAGIFFLLLVSPLFLEAQIFTAWYFEGSAIPSVGTGSITTRGGTTTGFNSSINVMGGTAFSNSNFPAQGTNPETAGLEIAASTSGKAGIFISWIQRHSGSSSRYLKVLISTNGTDFSVLDLNNENASATLLTAGAGNASNVNVTQDVFEGIGEDTWHRRTLNLSAITAVDNNPNFKFRLVSAFEPNTTAYTATGVGRTYATTGNYRYDSLEITAATILPLDFTSLQAYQMPDGIQLQWKTAREKGVKTFTIQHGTDGRNFMDIGTKPATNFSNGSYTFFHAKVYNGENFYRVEATDKDGTRQLSPVIKVQVSSLVTPDSYIFPTYVQNQATLTMYSDRAYKSSIQVFNAQGKLVFSRPVVLKNGTNIQPLNLGHLPAGTYFVQYPDKKSMKTSPIIKN